MAGHIRHRWIIVTAEAWPFVTERGFSLCTTALAESAPGILDRDTQELANDLENWLRPRSSALSLEVLRRFRDSAWFPARSSGTQPERVQLDDYLRRVAHHYLRWDGNRVSLRTDSDGDLAERARRYRWLSLLLPGDLLAATLAEQNQANLADAEIQLVTPQLDQVLRRGVAETHFHVGAALRFSEIWAGLMREIAYGEARAGRNCGTAPFGNWEIFQRRLLEAAVTRLLMARYLRHVALVPATLSFLQYVNAYARDPSYLRSLRGSDRRLALEPGRAIASLRDGTVCDPDRARLRLAYQRLLGRALQPLQ